MFIHSLFGSSKVLHQTYTFWKVRLRLYVMWVVTLVAKSSTMDTEVIIHGLIHWNWVVSTRKLQKNILPFHFLYIYEKGHIYGSWHAYLLPFVLDVLQWYESGSVSASPWDCYPGQLESFLYSMQSRGLSAVVSLRIRPIAPTSLLLAYLGPPLEEWGAVMLLLPHSSHRCCPWKIKSEQDNILTRDWWLPHTARSSKISVIYQNPITIWRPFMEFYKWSAWSAVGYIFV